MLKEIGLSENECENITKLVKTEGEFKKIEEKLKNFCKNPLFEEGLNELKQIDNYLSLMGSKAVKYNLSIIRGHNYYTGTVFEGFLKGKKNLGAVGGGGRFENLCSYFSKQKMPGVGMSVGITRLFNLLMSENYFDLEKANEIDCAIITFDETFDYGIKFSSILRQKCVKAENFYENKTFKSKMKEANKRNINYVIIIGEDEIKEQKFTLKNMQTSDQEKLTVDEIVKKIKG